MTFNFSTDCKLSEEDRLLLACARLRLSSSRRRQLDRVLAGGSLRWRTTLDKARTLHLSGFLFHHLAQDGLRQSVPTWAMEELQRTYFRNGLRNRLLQEKLRQALEALQRGGIPVVALKGAALLETVYPNGSLRPMADLDLLVPEEAADLAQVRVIELGYAPVGSPEEQENTRAVHQHLPKLVDSRELVKFEIHSHIVARDSPFRFDITGFWNRARPASVAGIGIRIPAPEHMLIHLAVHFFLERRFRSDGALRQICDIAETAAHYQREIDWAFLAEEVITHRLRGPVHCGLFLARELLDAPIPAEFLTRISPEGFSAASAQLFVRRRVLDDKRVLASELVKAPATYNLPNLVSGVFSRVFPRRAYLETRYSAPAGASSPGKLYLLRLADGLGLLARCLLHPLVLGQQLRVDRWMHEISSESWPKPPGSGRQSPEAVRGAITVKEHQEVSAQ